MERKNVQKNPAVASYCDRFEKISMDLCLAQLSMLSAEKIIIIPLWTSMGSKYYIIVLKHTALCSSGRTTWINKHIYTAYNTAYLQ